MASAEYYLGTQAAQQYHDQRPPTGYPPTAYSPGQPQFQQKADPWPRLQYNTPPYANTPPPSYSPYAPQQQKQTYAPPPPSQQQQPYPEKEPQGTAALYFPPPPRQPNGYLGPPLQHVRSHSQPSAPVQFADQASTALGSEPLESDSDYARRRRCRHRGRGDRTREYDRSRDRDSDSDYSDRDHDRSRSRRDKPHQKTHDSRDTFLGAGAGGIIGDALFPGLGTAAGLIIGGLGGRKYARDKRSKSEEGSSHPHRDAYREGREEGREHRESGRHRHRDAYREGKEERRRDRARDSGYGYDQRDVESGYGRDDGYSMHDGGHKQRGKHRKYGQDGWDEGSATFKSGTAVR